VQPVPSRAAALSATPSDSVPHGLLLLVYAGLSQADGYGRDAEGSDRKADELQGVARLVLPPAENQRRGQTKDGDARQADAEAAKY
jgi:hypothetical protein